MWLYLISWLSFLSCCHSARLDIWTLKVLLEDELFTHTGYFVLERDYSEPKEVNIDLPPDFQSFPLKKFDYDYSPNTPYKKLKLNVNYILPDYYHLPFKVHNLTVPDHLIKIKLKEYHIVIADKAPPTPTPAPVPSTTQTQTILFPSCKDNSAPWSKDGQCYKLHGQGPCGKGQLLLPRGRSADCAPNQCKSELDRKDPKSNECFQLSTQGPCPRGEWWVLNQRHPDQEASCRMRPCPAFHGFITGKCHQLFSSSGGPCPQGSRLYNDIYGNAKCECLRHHYKVWTDICHSLYTRGPCQPGHVLILDVNTKQTQCQKNQCDEGLVWWGSKCWAMGDTCQSLNFISINPNTSQLGCWPFFRPSL